MPRDQTKGKQPSVEPAGHEEEELGEGSSGEMNGELVPSTATKHSSIPGFSAVQVHGVNSVIYQMTTMMDVKIQAQNQRFEGSQSSLMTAIQQINQSMQQMQQMQQNQQFFPAAEKAEDSQQTAPATQPNSPSALPQDDKRWIPDDVGEFDGTGDVFAITD